MNTDAIKTLLPSTEDIKFYHEHGYYVTGEIIPVSIIEDALYGVERFYKGERDSLLPLSGGVLDWHPEHGAGLRINDYVSLQNEELRALVSEPIIAAIAGHLAEASVIRLFHDQLIGKPPSNATSLSVVGWHVDRAYWKTCTSDSMITAWVPLVDITPDNGPLTVIDGSHRWGGHEWMTTFPEQDLAALEGKIDSQGQEIKREALNLKAGQVSFHHGRVIHCSPENRSGQLRCALTIHFQDGDNKYCPHLDSDGRRALHINDLLCRKDKNGHPDYADPDICPVLWQREPNISTDK